MLRERCRGGDYMTRKTLHQFLEAISSGDATSDHAFLIRGWLREFGFESEIYASHVSAGLEKEVRQYMPGAFAAEELVIYHHTIGSANLNDLIRQRIPLMLIYHNITPPGFFEKSDPALAKQLVYGREQLQEMRPNVQLALGASPYSREELDLAGYEKTGVLPIVLHEADYDLPLDERLQETLSKKGPTLLFVGRVVPNKCQEDLVKLLYSVRHVCPQAHLVLVGGIQGQGYVRWLKYFIGRYGLADAVTLAGHVSQREMVTYYKASDVFVSMSEHEGFGKPLIESMYLHLPVMAYAAAAVPSTLGKAGILFTRKEFEPLSEMVRLLFEDNVLRRQVIATQQARVQTYLEPTVKQQFRDYLSDLALL